MKTQDFIDQYLTVKAEYTDGLVSYDQYIQTTDDLYTKYAGVSANE